MHLWEWLQANFWLIVSGVGGVIIAIYTIKLYRLSLKPEPVMIDRRNRPAMLDRVRSDWIDGVLDQSLYKIARIKLGLKHRPDAVERPLRAIIQVPEKPPVELSPRTPIVQTFDEQGQALLILGAPGTGKTTLLLELARDLLDRAETDENHKIPVVFNLSSWSVQRKPLDQWLVNELNDRYDVPRKVARAWVEKEEILPLLDGLDEVAADHRDACAAAINEFRRDHGFVPVAVCSRIGDYEALATKLRVRNAVLVQPLTQAEIRDYIALAGKPLEPVRAALQVDDTLWQLMETPLMLWVAMLAYQEGVAEFSAGGTLERQRAGLFKQYVDAMFKRRAPTGHYTQNKSIHWLSRLAALLMWNKQSAFHLEDLHPGSLPIPTQRWLARVGAVVAAGLGGGLGGLGIGAILGLASVSGLVHPVLVKSMVVGFFGLVMGLIAELIAFGVALRQVELLPVRLAEIPSRINKAIRLGSSYGLRVGLVFGLVTWLIALVFRYPDAAYLGLGTGMLSGLSVGLVVAVISALFTQALGSRSRPNEGTWRSLTTALVVGPVVGVICGPASGRLTNPETGLLIGLFSGLLASLVSGGSFCVKHLAARLILRVSGWAPPHYIRFLDFASERLFLRKVGGGYIFLHRMLMEYFADLIEPVVDTRRIARPRVSQN